MRKYVTALAVLAGLAGATVPLTGLASAKATAPAVKSVTFSGTPANPKITVTGTGFGKNPPKSYPNDSTSCGSYTNNGSLYGPGGLWILDKTNTWRAGRGTNPGHGNCIGLIVTHWSPTKVVFHFGNAYPSVGEHWILNAGDHYTLQVKGSKHHGKVSYSA
jgi:hypothetical protein